MTLSHEDIMPQSLYAECYVFTIDTFIRQLSFLARTIPPAQLATAASRFDARIIRCFHVLTRTDSLILPTDTSAEQVRSQISLPLSAGGMGLRPVERVSPSAYFASAAAVMPDFIRAFPPERCADYTRTQLHDELEECRRLMTEQGVGAEDASASSQTAVHATPKRHGRAPPPPPQMSGRARQAAQASRGSSGEPDASALRPVGTLSNSVTHLWSRAKQHAARTVS